MSNTLNTLLGEYNVTSFAESYYEFNVNLLKYFNFYKKLFIYLKIFNIFKPNFRSK